MKTKFSVSVDMELCQWLDAMIKERVFSSRSHGVEYAINELRKKRPDPELA